MRFPSPVLPNWRPRSELSRPSADALDRVVNRKATLTYAGPNAVIPIVYGEQVVAGPIIAGPAVSGSTLVYAVALCWAGGNGIEKIEDVRLGDQITVLPGTTGSVGGVSVQVYHGMQTGVNAQLAGAIPGFNDAFTGVAYARVSFNSSAGFTSLPQISFRVKGRKCFDPRTSATEWTENPALHMYDFVTNAEFGMGVGMIGAEAAADIADSFYGGFPRLRTGLTIQDPMTEEDALALFAEYAEVFWQYDGRDVTIIPDAPVDTVHDISVSTIRDGSISLSTVGLEQIPTQVRIEFTDRDEPEWPNRPAVAEVPEHTMHGLPVSPSSVPLPGVFNRLEAERRAYQRLMRLQAPGRVQWQMLSPGLPYQAGDVVRLPNRRGLQSVAVRLTSQPEMIAPLIYQMGGEIYSRSHYPSNVGGVAVPTGAIMILRGSGAVPEGWDAVNMGGRLVREGVPGNAGSSSTVSIPVTIAPAGSHIGARLGNGAYTSSAYSDSASYWSSGDQVPVPDHNHSVPNLSINAAQGLNRQQVRWVKRTGGPILAPRNIAFLASKDISSQGVIESAGLSGAYLSGGSIEQQINKIGATEVATSTNGSHKHGVDQYTRVYSGADLVERYFFGSSGGHSHTVSATFETKLRSMAMAIFESLGDAQLPPGAIVGWDSSALPPDWALCDGTNGTVDLTDRFIYITGSENAGVEYESDSSLSIQVGSSTSHSGWHGHGTPRTMRILNGHITLSNYHGPGHGGHSHPVTSQLNYSLSMNNIVRYQLRFIQYIGA